MEYQSNSNKNKEKPIEERNIKKIVSDPVIMKKKSRMHRIVDVFLPEDIGDVKSYLFTGVLVPMVKSTLLDTVHALLYGKTRKSSYGYGYGNGSNGYMAYDKVATAAKNAYSNAQKPMFHDSYEGFIIRDRGQADDVLAMLDTLLDKYGMVRVSDYKELVGVSSDYTDNDYGWTDLRSSSVSRVPEGWIIRLPRAVPIGR